MQRELINLSTSDLEELVHSDDASRIRRAVAELEYRSSRRARALASLGRVRLKTQQEPRRDLPILVLPSACRDQNIDGLSDSVRLLNLLHKLGIETLADLANTSWAALAALSGMGRKTLVSLVKAVADALSALQDRPDEGSVVGVNELPISLEAIAVLDSWNLETVDAIRKLSSVLSAVEVRRSLVVTDALMDGRVRWAGSSRGTADDASLLEGDATPAWMPPVLPRDVDRDSGGPDIGPLTRFIRLFNRWRSLETPPLTLGRVIDGDRKGLPPELQAIADACADILKVEDGSVQTAEQEFEEWFRDLEHRDRQILLRRVLRTHDQDNLAEIGEDFGVSRERIRQLANRLEDRLLQAIGTEPRWRATRWKVHRIRDEPWRFVAFCDLSRTDPQVTKESVSEPSGAAFLGLLALSTGMIPHGECGWLEKNPGELVQATDDFNAWLREAAWCTLDEARQHGIRLGCHRGSVDNWLREFTATKEQGEGLLFWPDGYEGRISSILERRGEALSVTEICEIYGSDTSELSIRSALSRYDSFVKVSRSAWGLADWGERAFEGIAPAIKAKIEERGGEALIAEISSEVAEEYDVRAHSVALIAQAPCFRVAQGRVRLRAEDDPYRPKDDLQTSRGLFLTKPSGASILLEVTHEMLRGSGTAMPESLGAHLGVLPAIRKGFHLADQKVTLSWPETAISGPTLGSIRGRLRSMGIGPGDLVRLDFNAEDLDLSIEHVDFGSLEAEPDAALRAVTGLSGSGETLYLAVAQSLRARRDALRGILVRRGDGEIATSIPLDTDTPLLQQALGDLGQAFSDP